MHEVKIPVSKPFFGVEEIEAVKRVVKSGWLSAGKEVKKFEKKFAEYIGTKYGIATDHGTSALHVALAAIEVGREDEVIVPSFSFSASADVVLFQRAKPVFVDIEEKTYTIDSEKIEEAITERTKAIIPVHLFGQSAEMDKIMKIAKEHKLYVIEDAAESHGSEYKGRRTGSLGHIGCFSFYPNKNMTTGEGGICTTNDKKLAKKIMMLRNHGRDKSKGNYFHVMLGFNYMMTDLQATIGLVQLKRLNWVIKQKIKMAEYYTKQFKKIGGVTTPFVKHYNKHTYMFYPILIKNRDKIAKSLSQHGIETSKAFYPPIHEQPVYQKLGFENIRLPVTEEISKRVLCIPLWVGLKRTQQDQIIRVIKKEI